MTDVPHPGHDPVADCRVAEQPQLQPGHLRAGSLDAEPADGERRRAARLPERVHRAVHRAVRTNGCRPATSPSRPSRTCRTGRTSTHACRRPTICSATARPRSRRAQAAASSRIRSGTAAPTTQPRRCRRRLGATWNDNLFGAGDPRSGNFVPDCDSPTAPPTVSAARGRSGVRQRQCRARVYDPAIMNGWGVRP